jgi:hypothetical protein
VLEVALVRLCRPDADRSLDAVLDRLDRLERSAAAGTVPEAAMRGSAAAPAAPAPARPGPAAEAHAELARAQAAGAPDPPRPARAPVKKATAPRAAPPPAAEPVIPESRPTEDAPAVPSREELEVAWDGGVLAALKPGTRAVFGTGHFVDSLAGSARFALQNDPTREHCEKKRPEVEAALAAHFGRPIALLLVTAAEVGEAPPAPASAPPTAPEEDEAVDVHALEDAPSATTGVERLAEAFPGAKLVEEP